MRSSGVLHVGDWVHVDGDEHQIVALTGTTLRLRSDSGAASVVLVFYLLSAPDFALVEPGKAQQSNRLGCWMVCRTSSWPRLVNRNGI